MLRTFQMTLVISCLHIPAFRSHAPIVLEKSKFVSFFSYKKAYLTKFDLAVKQVKVNPGSSFEQTMMSRSPHGYIPSFVKIGLLVPEKKVII